MDRLRQTIDKTETNEIVLCLGCGNESSNNKNQLSGDTLMKEFSFPPKVAKKLKEKYPKASSRDIEAAFLGAVSYFVLCKKYRNNNIPMPSVVVDDVWHEFILHTRDYEAFCKEFLGFFLHHVPNDDDQKIDEETAKEQMVSLWILACQEEGFDPASPLARPSLFYADVLFKVRNESYLEGFSKEVRDRITNKGKAKKEGFIATLKKSVGFTAAAKLSDAAASAGGNFDLTTLLMTVDYDVPVTHSSSSGSSSNHNSSSRNDDHHSTSRHDCNSSSHHSCNSSPSSCSSGTSCSGGCGGGGGD